VGWLLVAIVGVNVVLMAIYSVLKAGSDADDYWLGEDQYNEK
jgi:hypothetical protein